MTEYTTESHEQPKDIEQSAFEDGKRTTENRGMMIFVGVVTLLAGFIAISMPLFASLTAALVLGWLLIASGTVGLVTAFRRHAGWHIAAAFGLAVISIITGLLVLLRPLAGVLALSTIIIAYFAASGFLRVYYGAHGSVGPSLQGFADRAYVAGVLPNEPGGLVRWLVDPTAHAPQTAMPDLGMTDGEARDIAAYLYTLRGQ